MLFVGIRRPTKQEHAGAAAQHHACHSVVCWLCTPTQQQSAHFHGAALNVHNTCCLLALPLRVPQIETWDVSRQRPGPNWRLAQFFTYWHARQAHVAQQAKGQGKQPTVAAGKVQCCCSPLLDLSICHTEGKRARWSCAA
jgi:hypothetical protein